MNNDKGSSVARVPQGIFERAEARLSVDLRSAKLRRSGEPGASVVIADLSRKGFKTEWPYQLRSGDRVWLSLPGLEAKPAIVRWTKGYTIGCEFEQEMHGAVFDHLVRRLAAQR